MVSPAKTPTRKSVSWYVLGKEGRSAGSWAKILTDGQSHQASDVVKQQGGRNDLLERIKKTEFFKVSPE
jgi:hypothetical protein